MPVTYAEAGPDVYKLLRSVMSEFFQDLTILDPEIRIKVLMASGTAIPCLKKHGSAVVCDVKVTKGEERASGDDVPDVRFLIDRATYDLSKDRRRRSMLARLCAYLEIKTHAHETASKLCCDLDEYERPVVKLNPPDWQTEGFHSVVEWFGEDSWEHRELMMTIQDLGQERFSFMSADDADDSDQSAVADRVAEIEEEADEPAVSSVTLSSGDRSVTLTGKHFDEIGKAGKKLRRKAAMSGAK